MEDKLIARGKMIKLRDKWYVGTVCYGGIWSNLLELDPDDAKQIEEDSKVFDDIDARIEADPYVEYQIVLSALNFQPKYAKLVKVDKERQAELIKEIMHADEDLGLYDWSPEETKTFARLHLEGLKQDREKLKKEIEELKRGIEKIEEMKRELEEKEDKTFKRKSQWTKVQKKEGKLLS